MTWPTRRGVTSDGFPPATRAAILKRDPFCTCPGCPRCTAATSPNTHYGLHVPTSIHCLRASTDADHIVRGAGDGMNNGRGLCKACHADRTSQQALAARGLGPLRRRPAERHPGLR